MKDFADQIDPVGVLILVKDDEVDRELSSGMVLPESAKVAIETGRIVKTGPDAPPEYQEGRRLVFRPGAGIPVCLESDLQEAKVLRLLAPSDVKCFLGEEDAA